jgi:curved DNA-binding protein CbpA
VYTTFVNHYELLHIPFTATAEDIKAAYRKLARETHPDMHPEEAEHYTRLFQEIKAAYETLSNPIQKNNYDLIYRQVVLGEQPQYEYYYEDPVPEDNTVYTHRYTARTKKKFNYYPFIILIFLGFQFFRLVKDSAPIHPTPYNQIEYTDNEQINRIFGKGNLLDSNSRNGDSIPFIRK